MPTDGAIVKCGAKNSEEVELKTDDPAAAIAPIDAGLAAPPMTPTYSPLLFTDMLWGLLPWLLRPCWTLWALGEVDAKSEVLLVLSAGL